MPYPSYTIGGKIDWSMVPGHMIGGLRRYIERGIPPGSFLTAVLSNDLKEACHRADETNKRCLWDFVYFLYNYAPRECWGGPERVREWIEKGGLKMEVRDEAD